MAFIRAYRSGRWSDNALLSSPWYSVVTGLVYTPGPGDDVFANGNIIDVDTNIAVKSLTVQGLSRTWIDGTTSTSTVGGTFNLNNGVTINALEIFGPTTTSVNTITLSGTKSATVICPSLSAGTNTLAYGINTLSEGVLTFIGNITNRASNNGAAIACSSPGTVNIIGTIISNNSFSFPAVINRNSNGLIKMTGNITVLSAGGGIGNLNNGSISMVGNIESYTLSTNAYGINQDTWGYIDVIGNLTTYGNSACISSNGTYTSYMWATNKISGNIVNSPNGTAAVFLPNYFITPVPKNGTIQFPDTTFHLADSLSAFSMPQIQDVRYGTRYANNTLSGICAIPSKYSVVQGVSTDNTIGEAIFVVDTLYNVPLSALTIPNTVGSKVRTLLTTEAAGYLFSSFTKN
jgi:hypothetical protein